MASPLQPFPGRTVRRAALALAGTVGILMATVPASAAPTTPGTAAEAAELVAARGHDLEALSEQFNEARENLAAQQAAAQTAQVEVERATAVLTQAQQSVRGVARSAYTGSGLNSFQALMKASKPVVTSAGHISGRNTRVMITHGVAPSTMAASSISTGRSRMKVVSTQTVKGSVKIV